jgi:hypothetical protein
MKSLVFGRVHYQRVTRFNVYEEYWRELSNVKGIVNAFKREIAKVG